MNNLFLFEHDLLHDRVAFTQLLENRLDFIKSKLNHLHDAAIDHIANTVDPTKNKKYTEWLISRKLRGDWHPNENKIRTSLSDFDKAKSDVHDTNIKNHSITSMMNTAHLVRTAQPAKFTQLNKIFDDVGAVGFEVPNKETSIHFYGPASHHPTNWCTAAAGSRNMFDSYEGGKYTLHLPNGHYLQLHHQSHQLKDPQNQEINLQDDSRYSGHLSTIEKFMRQTGELEDHTGLTEKHFGIPRDEFNRRMDDIIDNDRHTEMYRLSHSIAQHPLSDKHFNYLLSSVHIKPTVANRHLTHEQIHHIVHDDYLMGVNSFVQTLAKNPALKDPEHVDRVFSTLFNKDLPEAGQIHNLSDAHINKLVDSNGLALMGLVKSKQLSEHHLNKLLDKEPKYIAQQAAHFTVPEKYRKHVFDSVKQHASHAFLNKFAEHNHITPEEMDDYIEATKSNIDQHRLLDNKFIQPHHVDRIVDNTKYHDPEISEFLGKPDMIGYKKINNSHIEKLLAPPFSFKPTEETLRNYLNKPSATTAMADKLHDAADLDMSARSLNSIGYHRLKDYNPELLNTSFHASQYAKDLGYHPKMKAQHLTMLLNGLAKGFTLHSHLLEENSLKNILNHPNLNMDHIKQLQNDWGVDEHYNSLINSHPRIAGLIKE